MAIGTQNDSEEMLSEINMIPFIDVMLVLLIIFIITVPVINHAVKIDLPQASSQKLEEKPANVRLAVNADGSYLWNDVPVDDRALETQLAATRMPGTSGWPRPWPPPNAPGCTRSAL
jgi:biopolymer transport protein ExbD